MPSPLNVSSPNCVYLVLLIPLHKSTPIHSLHSIHLFPLMRGPAALTAVHGWAGAAGGALLTSPIAQSFGDRSSAVLSLSTPSPYCSAQLCSPARLLLSVFFEFLHFLSFFFLTQLQMTKLSSSQTTCKCRNELFLVTEIKLPFLLADRL